MLQNIQFGRTILCNSESHTITITVVERKILYQVAAILIVMMKKFPD